MSTYENEIINYSAKKKKSSLEVFANYSDNKSREYTTRNSGKAAKLTSRTSRKMSTLRKKQSNPSAEAGQVIIDDAVGELSSFHLDTRSSYIDIISTFGASLVQDVSNSINLNLQSKFDTIAEIPVELTDVANSQILDIAGAINDSVGASITKYTGEDIKQLNDQTAALNSLKSKLTDPIGSFNINNSNDNGIKNNFFKRDKGRSSCSNYIQGNVPNKAGKLTSNPDALKGTPDAVILKPKLSMFESAVSQYKQLTLPKLPSLPSLSSLIPKTNIFNSAKTVSLSSIRGSVKSLLTAMPPKPSVPNTPSTSQLNDMASFASIGETLGFTPPLIPSKSITPINEPAPTPEKAEYGKIVVKENKAGFVEITDETPGNKRKINQHPSGTYEAMVNDGSVHRKITKDRQEITDGEWKVTTSKDKVEIIIGDSKIEVRKSEFRTISGNDNIDIGGDIDTLIGGSSTEDIKLNKIEKIGGNNTTSIAGDKTDKTDGNHVETISGDYNNTTKGNLTITVTGNVNINSSGQTTINSTGPATISSTALVRISAPKVNIG
jgi:hypothetical protein